MSAASSPYMETTKFSTSGWHTHQTSLKRSNLIFPVSSAQQDTLQLEQESPPQSRTDEKEKPKLGEGPRLRPVEPQLNVKSKNMSREYGGQWLSSTTRHVRIYAAYIDPVTCKFDQTQMDKLTIILDPSDEFLWTTETCNKVYGYFQDLVDHYEGAPLTEYTLRLIGSDVEHYTRKLLYDGEIQYNMNARVLNFSMGKPRIMFHNAPPDPSNQQEATPSSSFTSTSTEGILSSAHHFIPYVPAA